MLSSLPDEWGPKFELEGGAVIYTSTGPNAIRFTAHSHMALVMFTAQPGREIAVGGDRRIVSVAPVGSLELIPASSEIHARWLVEKQSLLVAVETDRLKRLASVEFDAGKFELHPPRPGFIDEKSHLLAQWIRRELTHPQWGGKEYLDALLTIFATHLLRNHSSLRDHPSPLSSGGLPPHVWRRINDFIQASLADNLSLERLASMAGLSPSHFTRAFRQTTGESPYQYVISSRIARARKLIVGTDMPLGEIAKTVGFSSNSHMTALTRRTLGVTPTDLRRKRRSPEA